jgi:uncharacterized repeat protein (TIGR01451 family)/fimbrial isopeptide formation D2 family protein
MPLRRVRRWPIAVVAALLLSPVLAVFLNAPAVRAAPNDPVPLVKLPDPWDALIGSTVSFDVSFVNDGPNTGYGPYIDLTLPLGHDGNDGLTFLGATYLGASVTPVQKTAIDDGTGHGIVLHPYALDKDGAPVVIHGLAIGQSYVVLRLPFGSFTPGQPKAVVHITTQMSDGANVGWPLDLIADGGFQFGRTPLNDPTSGDPSILQDTAATTHVTPTIILVSKTYNGPEHETATGPDFPESYTITATIAKDQPVTDLILSDTLPDNMQYLSTDATAKPSSAVDTPDTGIPGGVVSRNFGPVTGTGGEDAKFTFHFYIPRLDAAHADVLPPATGAFADSVDTARADANWLPVDIRDREPDNALTPISAGPVSDTIKDKSVAIQKHVSLLTDLGAPGASPGDTLEWTMQVQVSDYFALQNVVVYDHLGDGTIWDGIAPTMSVDGNNFTSGQAVMTNYSHVDPDVNGITAFEFRISDELMTRGQETGRMIGGCIDPVNGTAAPDCTGEHSPVTATITFKSVIQQTYIKAGKGQVVEGDTLGNLASVTGDVLSTTAPFAPTASSIGDGSYAVASAGTSASITIERGELEKTIYAINGAPVPEGPVHVSPGDTITYELKQHFPTSRTDDFRMTDYLPLPIFDAAKLSTPPTHFDSAFDAHWALNPANPDYVRDPAPTADTAKYGPGDTFHALDTVDSGPAPTPTIAEKTPSSTSANSVEFHYGDYALYPPAPSVADILFTVTVSDKPFADGLLFTNQARSETKNAVGDLQTADAIIQITLDQPVLAITKGVVATSRTNAIFSPAAVGPAAFSVPPGAVCPAWTGGSITSAGLAVTPIKSDLDGVDAGDYVRFAIVVENTGHADAFKVHIADAPHAGFVIPTGGLDLCANDGAGNSISTTDLSGGLFGSGIQLADGSDGAVARGVSGSTSNATGTNIAVITYTLQVADTIVPDTTVTNVASLLDYADGPVADGHLATPLTDDATVHTTLPTATKEIAGTSLATTTLPAVTVGEVVTYRVTLTIPEGKLPVATVTDHLPAGMAFVDCVSIVPSQPDPPTPSDLTTSLAGGFSDACSAGTNPAVSNGGRDVAFSLGNISNANRNDGVAETLQINYRAVVLNAATNVRGHTMTNSATLTWDGGALGPVSADSVRVAEPWITLTKTPSSGTADAGDTITYTVTVTNDGTDDSDAYGVAWSDTIPAGMAYVPTTLKVDSGDAATSLTITGGAIAATWDDLPAGHSTTIKYSVIVGDDAVPDHVFHNAEAVAWSSLPGSDPNERTGNTGDPGGILNNYRNSAHADVDVPAAAVAKAVTSTSMAGTQGYAVGEIVTYRVTVTIPEGQLPGATITDSLPAGMALVDCSSIRALSDGVVSVAVTTSLAGGFGDACHAGSNPSVANAGQDVVFTLGDITNSDRANDKVETLEINYTAVVLNVTGAGHDNRRGHPLANTATLNWTGATSAVTSTAATVHVVEPIMGVVKSVDKTTGDAGDEFTFTVVITNPTDTNGSTGFEATWKDQLPTGLDYESGLAATTCDVAPTTLTATGNDLLAIWPIFNAGDSCTLTYKAILADNVPSGASYQNSAALAWTSLPGIHNTLPTRLSTFNDVSTERTGNLSDPGTTANTYLRTSSVTVNVTQPAPVKSFVSTSEAGTSDTGLTVATNTLVEIGEIVRYRVAVTIPEGVTPNVSIKDTLAPGLQYLNDNTTKVAFVTNDLGHARMTSSTLNSDPQVTGNATWALHPTYVLPSGSISVAGNTPKFDFGDITNNDRDDDKEEIVVEFNVLALNVTGNKSAGPPTVLTDKASLWTGSAQTWQIDSNQLTETIAEPIIVDTANFDKTVSPGNGVNDAGDTITYTITIANAGNAPAYDYHLTDTLPANLESPPTNIGVVCGSGTYDKSASAGAVVDVTMTEIDPTKSCVVTVAAKVGATEQANTLFRNTADGIYTSLPGDHGTDAAGGNITGSTTPGDPASGTGERTGLPADSLNHYVNTKYVDLTLKAPSIVKNIPTLASAPIGAQTTFDLVVTVPEGKTRGLSVTDSLPWGLKPITATVIQLAADSGYSGGNRLAADFSGALGTVSEAATPSDISHRLWTWTFAGDGTNDVVVPATNTPNDDQFLIRITAQVDNILVNLAGHPLDNSAVVTYTNPQTGNPANVGSATRTVTVYEPDLTVTKTVSNASPHFGQPVTYTLTIKHTTGATDDITAYDVSLADAIPAGMAYVADSLGQTANLAPTPTTWGYSGGNITMTWDSFPLGGPDTVFTYQATVNAPSPLKIGDPIMNTAATSWTSLPGDQAPSERTGADGIGAGFLNNYRVASTSTVTVTGADMTISKDDNQPTAAAADVLRYVVHYQNDGNQAATNVVIDETVPVGTTFNTALSTGTWIGCSNGSIAGTACHLNIASVAAHLSAGDSGNYTFAVKVVDPIASTRVTIDNTATIADDGTNGPDPTDNNSVTHTDTTQTADLSLTKTRDVARPNANQIVHFTLTLTNAGPDPATNVVVHDTWPAGLTWVSDDSSGAYNHSTGTWTIGGMGSSGPTATKTLVITARATSVQVSGGLPQPIVNVAEATHSGQRDPDSTPNNGVTTEDDYATASVTPTLADMAVTKTVDNGTPNVGEYVTFTITATNNGPDIATNARVVETLPSGLTWVSSTPSVGTWSGSTWTIGDLANGASATLSLTVHVVTPGLKTNTATVSADPFDPDSNNNIALRGVTPQQADLTVGKNVNNLSPEIGETVTFTVTVDNNIGPDTATNVALTDLLPGGLTYVSKTVSQGTYDETTGAWTVGTLLRNTSATLTIHATVNSSGTITNTASVSHSDQYDPVSANNTAHVDLASRIVDVGVAKTVDHATPNVGDTIHYTLTVTNHSLAFGVTLLKVTDLLPEGVSYVSDTGGGAYNSTTGVWDIGSLALNTSVTKTITVLVTASGHIDNTLSFTSMLQTDTNSTNNTATVPINVPLAADIAVTKTVDNNRPNVGSNVTFTVTATNNGPDNATGVRIADALPAGLTLTSPTPSDPTTYSSGTWDIGNLDKGASATLTLTASVDTAGLRTNTASVSHSDQSDPVPGNNSASAAVDQRVDLTVSKSVDHPAANVGATETFTIGVSNAGPNTGHNVKIADLLPAGLTYVSDDAAGLNTYVSTTGVWTIDSIASGGSATLHVVATLGAPGPDTYTGSVTNTATVQSANETHTDHGPAHATVTPPQADLEVTKTVVSAKPDVGEEVVYTIALKNLGPDDATGVLLHDLLPDNMTYVSDDGALAYDHVTSHDWTVGDLASGATVTLHIHATVDAHGDYTNTAAVTHSDQYDPVTANNTDDAFLTTRKADVGVEKTVNHANPNVGDTVEYTITATNHGLDPATQIVINDLLPAGVVYVSDDGAGKYNPTTGDWAVGSLGFDASGPLLSTTLHIDARVINSGITINKATVKSLLQRDDNVGNDSATAQIDAPKAADLSLAKTVDGGTPDKGATVVFTLTVTNSGPDDTTEVVVNDAWPDGLTFVSDDGGGVYDSATGNWTVGNLNVGAHPSLKITATVDVESQITNIAEVTHSHLYDPDSTPGNGVAGEDDRATVIVNAHGVADLAVTKAVTPKSVFTGGRVTYTIVVTNHGPDNATGVIVRDELPDGVTYVSSAGGTYSAKTGAWTVGSLTNGSSASLTITATVGKNASITNNAGVAASDQRDPDPSNNADSAAIKSVPHLPRTAANGPASPDGGSGPLTIWLLGLAFAVLALTASGALAVRNRRIKARL